MTYRDFIVTSVIHTGSNVLLVLCCLKKVVIYAFLFSGAIEFSDFEQEKVHMIETTVTIRTRISLKEPPNASGENLEIFFQDNKNFRNMSFF